MALLRHEELTYKIIGCALTVHKNYLEAFDLPTGLLINFGAKSLQFKRLLNKKYGFQP